LYILPQFTLEVLQGLLDFAQIQFQLLFALPLVFNILLDTGDFTAQGIIGALDFLVGIIGLGTLFPHFLHVSFQGACSGNIGF